MRLKIAAVLIAATAGTATANPYEAFIDVESEEDLHDLIASQQITEDTYEVLLDLLHRGVDLNQAGRAELYSLPNLTYDDVDAILAYRAEQGFIRDPIELVAARVITEDKLLAMAAFLVIRDPFDASAVHGFAQGQSRFSVGDDRLPSIGVRTRVLAGKDLTAGLAAVMTRLRPGEVVYDPNRDALLADEAGLQPHLAKAYVHYETERVAAIIGTYRIGFGQRLTFDNSSDYTPHGIYRDDQLVRRDSLTDGCKLGEGEGVEPCDDERYVSPDLGWREGLLGVAAGATAIPVGEGWLSLHAWGSYQPRSIYQYELFDAAACDDPRNDVVAGCGAPAVFERPDGSPLSPAATLQYQTLPSMYAEALVGGDATFFVDRRTYLGVTAYGARPVWLVDDGVDRGEDGDRLSLDFQEWANRPMGGDFGAIGLHTAAGIRELDLAAEVAHSFDSMAPAADGVADGGGGPAVIVRTTYTDPKRHEIELSGRYYDTDFLNPYARPIAAPDEFEGQRARDEAGGRVRYTGQLGRVGLRSGVDVWTALSQSRPQGDVYLRADVAPSKKLRWGVWLDVQDRDLREGGRGACYDQDFELDRAGEPVDCTGMRVASTGRVRWVADRRLTLTAQATHELQDSTDYMNGFRQDLSAWLIAQYKVSDDLRLRGRVRYLSEDIADPKRLEESLWMYADAALRLRDRDRLRIRADLYVWLDDRPTTAQREPSPEVWVWAQYDYRF